MSRLVAHESVLGPCNYLERLGWHGPLRQQNLASCRCSLHTTFANCVNHTDERCYLLIEQGLLVGRSHIRHNAVEWRHSE